MTVPTQGEEFARLIEFIRKAQESSATLSHLASANDDKLLAQGWMAVSEMFKLTSRNVTKLAMRKWQ